MKPIDLPTPPEEQNLYAIDPLDSRYYDKEIARYLSESSRIAYQAYMEAALAQALAEAGICSLEVASAIERSARAVKAADVYKEETTTRHDIKALVNCIKAGVDDNAKPYVHFGATSNDIISSALALQLRDTAEHVVIPRLKQLVKTLISLAEEHANAAQIGRTHGQHAVPITFGFAIAEYVSRLGSATAALEALCKELVGKFSGAVGAYNALSIFVDNPLEFESKVLDKVGLKPAEYSTQIVPPDATIRLMDELAITAGIMANLAHDMRHLQRSEIAEVREKFEAGQTGSSTMAHKRYPWNFENVISMSKQVLAQAMNANLNVSSEHQRDLTDSASSRFYAVSLACVASMAKRLDGIMVKLEVDTEAMQRNLKLSGGAIAAEPLYLLFEKYGHTEAHEKSKALAHQALAANKPLVDIISADTEAAGYWQKFKDSEKKIIQEPEKYYTGLAAEKAKSISAQWEETLKT
ncbi:MAG TPA: lyase family protein [Candidatus Saccharimonadales bacterium]|nr:lyase family protein [Candidatus Saccharimonadales bacterium]